MQLLVEAVHEEEEHARSTAAAAAAAATVTSAAVTCAGLVAAGTVEPIEGSDGKYPELPPPYPRGFEPMLHSVACTRGIVVSNIVVYEIKVVHGVEPRQTYVKQCDAHAHPSSINPPFYYAANYTITRYWVYCRSAH